MRIITRAEWGAREWATTPLTVPLSARAWFLVHYDGGTPVLRTGHAIPRAIDAGHHAKGWAGIGYNFVVSQAGEVFEGRGWGLVGAHCPGRNRDGIGVQVAVGGDQAPTPAALAAVRALYDEATARVGRPLLKSWHGAHYATECPGPRLIAWVRAGMPTTTEVPMPTPATAAKYTDAQLAQAGAVWAASFGPDGDRETAGQRLAAAASVPDRLDAIEAKLDQLLAALVPKS